MLGLSGACCQSGRLFNWAFCPWGILSLDRSPRGRWPASQRRCPGRQGAKGAMPSPAKDCLSPRGETAVSSGVPGQAVPRGSVPACSPFSHLGASGTLGKLRDFSTAKREYISLRCIDEHHCPPFTPLVAGGDLALRGRTYFRTQPRNFSVLSSQKTSSLD